VRQDRDPSGIHPTSPRKGARRDGAPELLGPVRTSDHAAGSPLGMDCASVRVLARVNAALPGFGRGRASDFGAEKQILPLRGRMTSLLWVGLGEKP
jgi:hypothetical protein